MVEELEPEIDDGEEELHQAPVYILREKGFRTLRAQNCVFFFPPSVD